MLTVKANEEKSLPIVYYYSQFTHPVFPPFGTFGKNIESFRQLKEARINLIIFRLSIFEPIQPKSNDDLSASFFGGTTTPKSMGTAVPASFLLVWQR